MAVGESEEFLSETVGKRRMAYKLVLFWSYDAKRIDVSCLIARSTVFGGFVPETPTREPRHDLELRLVRALLSLTFMGVLDNRRLFVRELSRLIGGGFDVQENTATRIHVINIVCECLPRPHGLRCLAAVVELFAPEERGTIEVVRLVSSTSVLAVVSDTERREVLSLLSLADRVCAVSVESLWFAAADELAPLPGGRVETLGAAFNHLAELNARADGLPPALAFIEYVASGIMGDLATELRNWADNEASRMGLSAELSALRTKMAGTTLPALAPPCIIVQFAEHGPDPETFMMSHWTQHRPGPWNPQRGEDQIVTFNDAERAVEEAIGNAESVWGTSPGRASVEFVLPAKLLNHPVEWWHSNPGSPAETPLCLDYSITVRSLERMRTPRWHRFWRNRWSIMESANSLNACWVPENDVKPQQWNTQLHSDEEISAVILNHPPLSSLLNDERHLWMALIAGIPVILWDNRKDGGRDFAETINSLTRRPPMTLADRIKELRTQAALSNDGNNHPGLYIKLLWDDPDRQVDSWPYPSQITKRPVGSGSEDE